MTNFLVQASSVSWTGIQDLCMNEVDEKPAVFWTIKKIFDSFRDAVVTVIAPSFDSGGKLEALRPSFRKNNFDILYGHDASPLYRMIEATNHMDPDEHIIRVDGLHFWFDASLTKSMLTNAKSQSLDLVKLPDDFPAQLSSEIFKVSALRRSVDLLKNEDEGQSAKYEIHPKFYIQFNTKHFSSKNFEQLPEYTDKFLQDCRDKARSIYIHPRIDVGENSIPAGDSISYHYTYAKRYIKPTDKVLDIASGIGFGAANLAENLQEIVCADIDQEAISQGKKLFSSIKKMKFSQQDVTSTDFQDNEFDVVLSFETVEHVDENKFFNEIYRILKPGGFALVSTPQNRLGRIPITAEHIKEFSLKEITELAERQFDIENIIGIKAGTIWCDGDPYGSNTIVVARKPQTAKTYLNTN